MKLLRNLFGKKRKQNNKPAILVNGNPYAIFYGHTEPYTIKELEDESIYRIKAGRSTNLSIKSYRKKRMKTNDLTGKKFLWWDNIFDTIIDDKSLTIEECEKIAQLSDTLFKRQMRLAGYQANLIHKNEIIGDEVYESNDIDSLESFIHSTFKKCIEVAYTAITFNPFKGVIKPAIFNPRNGQEEYFINPLFDYFEVNDTALAAVHGGSGKTKMSCRLSELVCRDIYKSDWKVIGFANNRPNTIQLAYEFSKYYEGQTGKRNLNIYIVGSIDENEMMIVDGSINVISKSESHRLKKVLKDYYYGKKDCAIFIVNDSAEGFLELSLSIGVDFRKWFCIKDEVHTIVNESDVAKLETSPQCAIVNSKYRNLFGKTVNLTATPICRPDKCTNPLAVFNNDVEKFGKRVVDIDEIKARELGWICDVECIILPIPTDPIWIQSIKESRPFTLNLCGETYEIYPHIYPIIEAIRKYIIPNDKNHIIVNCGLYKDVDKIIEVLNRMKRFGLIPKEFSIIRGSAKTAQSDVNRFNNSEKAIIVATRWIGTGQDTYKADVVIPCYDPKSKAYRKQFLMRKDRLAYMGKLSWFVLPALDCQLEDSVWYEYVEYISNGMPVDIVSEADFINATNNTSNKVGGPNNPIAGTNFGKGNVKLVKSHDSIYYGDWLKLSQPIALKKYSDGNGNTKFSEIFDEIKSSINICDRFENAIDIVINEPIIWDFIIRRKLQSDVLIGKKDWELIPNDKSIYEYGLKIGIPKMDNNNPYKKVYQAKFQTINFKN